MNSVRSDFDAIAELGDSGSDRYDALLAALVPDTAGDVLEVGCGTGRLTVALGRQGRNVLGVDLSPNMIARAQQRSAGVTGVRFIIADFITHDFGGQQFDCVISSTMLHHVSASSAVPRMAQLVRSGGRLIVHDVRSASGLVDRFISSVAWLLFSLFRFIRTGRLRDERALREAWNAHGAGETYLTIEEARALATQVLPGARVMSHAMWRYTIVWDKA